jgi:hypothetical protein
MDWQAILSWVLFLWWEKCRTRAKSPHCEIYGIAKIRAMWGLRGFNRGFCVVIEAPPVRPPDDGLSRSGRFCDPGTQTHQLSCLGFGDANIGDASRQQLQSPYRSPGGGKWGAGKLIAVRLPSWETIALLVCSSELKRHHQNSPFMVLANLLYRISAEQWQSAFGHN